MIDCFLRENQPPVVFTDLHPDLTDFLVPEFPTGRPFFDDYVSQNREYAGTSAEIWRRMLATLDHQNDNGNGDTAALFHVCAIGERSEMLAFERRAHERSGNRIQTFVQRSPRYAGTMCEILRQDAGKWVAILRLAELWGVDPKEICAVGDDVNDIPMLRNAGLGVAMGHASRDVLEAADLVTGNHDQDGVACLVNDILLA